MIRAQNVPTGEWREEYSFFPAEIDGIMFSGDEWFYNHKLTTDEAGNQTGYVAVGYTSKPNLFIDETILEDPGCLIDSLSGFNCADFETDDITKGSFWPIIAKVNQQGLLLGSQRLGMRGQYHKVIQSSDGGYIAIGRTEGTRCIMDSDTIPIVYNPGRNGMNTFDLNDSECSKGIRTRGLITKFTSNLIIDWNFIYGPASFQDDVMDTSDMSTVFNDVVETFDGSIIAVGFSDFYEGRGYILKVDGGGHWISNHNINFSPEEPVFNIRDALYTFDNETENLYLGGERFIAGSDFPGVMKLNFTGSSPYVKWRQSTDVKQCHSNSATGIALTDMAISNNGKTLRIPIVVDGKGGDLCCSNRGKNGKAIIEVLDIHTGLSLNESPCDVSVPKKIIANDVRMGITNTKDGGFAVVSSIRDSAPFLPKKSSTNNFCPGQAIEEMHKKVDNVWETDAYIVKFTAENKVEWEKSFDSNSPRQANSQDQWIYPSLMHDVKLQECLYSITEDDKGQLTIAGNTSTNFDDAYMARVCNASLKNVISDQVDILIDNEVRTYMGNDNIIARGVTVINNSKVYFKAGSQINIKPISNNTAGFNQFHVKSGSVFHAKIYNDLICDPNEESGYFKTAGDGDQNITNEDDSLLSTVSKDHIVKVYPNPVDDILNIRFGNIAQREISIIDINGRLKIKHRSNEDEVQLDLKELISGIYFISILETNTNVQYVKRVIVQ